MKIMCICVLKILFKKYIMKGNISSICKYIYIYIYIYINSNTKKNGECNFMTCIKSE